MLEFAFQPTLVGPLVTLRPLRHQDWEPLYTCAADPELWAMHPQPTRYQHEVFRVFFDQAMASGGAFAVLDSVTGAIIGSTRFYEHKPAARSIVIGYTFLTRAYWGGRYNSEQKALMIEHAFRFVDRIYFEVGAKNLRSRRAVEKLGAQLSETLQLDGGPYVVYALDRPRP